ncbi:hypothetical protein [Tamlana flava]|uniref:hypothetical protein n=1 Tax=Tamlana flava TaxID=3158572 RepID=UPI00351ADF82
MKKLIYITFSILTIGLFSCSEDDSYSIAYVDTEVKTPLTGTLTFATSSAFGNTNVDYTINIPQSFEVASVVELTLTSTYEVLKVNTNIEKVYDTIPAGATTKMGSFVMPSFDAEAPFYGLSSFLTVEISGIALVQPPKEDEDGKPIEPYVPVDDPYTMTSEATDVTLLEYHDPYMAPNPKTLMISLDWEGPYGGGENDIDLYVLDAAFTTLYESSESGSRFEGDFFNNPANENHPDGDYVIEIGVWTAVSDAPIAYRLVLTHPDGTRDIFEGTVDPAVGYVDPVGFTKTTDGSGNVTYVTTAL